MINDTQLFTGLGGATKPFNLAGGRYLVTVIAGSWISGSAALWYLGPDNVTWVSVSSNNSANGGWVLDLCSGVYQVQFTGSIASGAVSVGRVPLS